LLKFCPNCKEDREIDLIRKNEIFPVKKEKISIDAELYVCRECKSDFSDFELEGRNFDKAFSIYRANNNLMAPSEIKSIREQYKLSQRALARFLGWSETIICEYENGRIPDRAHNDELFLLKDPNSMQKLYSQNRGNLRESEGADIETTLTELMNKEAGRIWENTYCDFPIDVYCGNRKFDFQKFKSMILYLLEKNNGLFKVKLNKLLYYSDFLFFKLHSISISGAQYVRLPHGPVPNNYRHFLGKMESDKEIEVNEVRFPNGYIGEEYINKHIFNKGLFSQLELDVIDKVDTFFKNHNSTSISDFSHNDNSVLSANELDLISYEFSRKLPSTIVMT
jgi:putative zinc finger/helix-turn-helix YgiT family protein